MDKPHDEKCAKYFVCWQCNKPICQKCAVRSGSRAVLCEKCANLTNEEVEAGWGDLQPEIIESLRKAWNN